MTVNIDYNLLKSLLTLATLIEARDAYTGGHTWRVSQYSRLLAEDLGMNRKESFAVQIGALVHDLGKVGIPDQLLNKPGKLEENEYRQMCEHPAIGLKAIQDHPLKDLIKTAIGQHHERPDGRGYPEKVTSDTLIMSARIVSLADAFDAMTSTRSYRKGMSKEKALQIVMENSGTQFDSDLSTRLQNLNGKGALDNILSHAYDGVPLLNCPECGPTMVPGRNQIEGDSITCPACTGDFILHKHADSYVVEFSGVMKGFSIPLPDEYSIESVLQNYQKEIRI